MGKPLIDSNCYIADNVPEALLNVTLVAPYLLFASVKGHLQAQDLSCYRTHLKNHAEPYIIA